MAARLRPSRSVLAALVGLVWAMTVGFMRDFVWADLRTGLIRTGDLPRPARTLVWIGFILLFALVGLLLFNDVWRANFDLLAAAGGTPGRGSLTPTAVIPATFYLLAVAWNFVLAGALHVRGALRLLILAAYLTVSALWIRSSLVSTQSPGDWLVAWGPLLGVVIWFIVRWRRPQRAALEFAGLFLLVAGSYALVQQRLVAMWRFSDTPLFLSILDSNVVTLAGLALPLLLLVGLDVADFVYHASSWVTGLVATYLGRLGVFIGLAVAAAGWLWWWAGALRAEMAMSTAQAVLVGYLSASLIPLSALLVWWLVERRGSLADSDGLALTAEGVTGAAHSSAPWFIVAFLASNLALIAVASLLVVVGSTLGQVTDVLLGIDALVAAHQRNLLFYLILLTLLAAAWAWWRRRRSLALYLGVLGTTLLWGDLTATGRPLARFAWHGPEVTAWWVLLVLGIGVGWLVRRRLTATRAARVLLVLCMAYLLRQTDFIGQPLSPLFSFSGIALIAFGLVWDALTIGSWANTDTGGLPRVSRIFLYLGYVLFTATIVNWVLTAHNLSYVDTVTGEAAMGGLKLVGRPMLYALSIVILAQPDKSTNQPVTNQPVTNQPITSQPVNQSTDQETG